MTDPVPVGVVGTGNMGSNHVRVYDELQGTELVEVVETDPQAATEIESAYGVPVRESVAALEAAQAVTIAVPTGEHRTVTIECLERGLDVLVEKPLAPSVSAARSIVDVANERDAVLQVGHIERFNPAVQTLEDILSSEEVVALEAHRLGPFNEHLSSENVVFDLMIHDLDVIDALVGGEIHRLSAIGAAPQSSATDHAVAIGGYDDGTLATATASHLTHGKVRSLTATTLDAHITLDYQAQRITVQRRGVEETTPVLDTAGYRTETVTETPYVRTREPLKNELEHFLDCVRERSTPRVDGAAGVRAVELASAVSDRLSASGDCNI